MSIAHIYPIAVTVDLDCDVAPNDEFSATIRLLDSCRNALSDFSAVVFVRLDQDIARRFGRADDMFLRFAPEIAELRANGHEIGWHPHVFDPATGRQATDEAKVRGEIVELADLARKWGLTSVRMGWGFHGNSLMTELCRFGFTCDSSAIPRPNYRWERSIKDWQGTPHHPYHPSTADYRRPGTPSHPILEVPFSMAPIRAPYDEGDVIRYLNPAFAPGIFQPAIARHIRNAGHIVMVTHPEEYLPTKDPRGLLAHDVDLCRANILDTWNQIDAIGLRPRFVTLSEFTSSEFPMLASNGTWAC